MVCHCYTLRQRAFTLVELLVVIAILAALIGITLTAVQVMRDSANRIKCANNQRQIGIALHSYANDNRGRFPLSTHSSLNFEKTWVYTLGKYLEDIDQVRICPADPQAADRLGEKGTSYVLNEYTCISGPGAALNLFKMPAKSRSIVVFTSSDERGVATTEDHTHSRNWFRVKSGAWDRICADIQPNRFGSRPGLPREQRTAGSANYLYADGHVEAIAASQVRQWADDGTDFALPPTE